MEADNSYQKILINNETDHSTSYTLELPDKIVTDLIDSMIKFLKKKYNKELVNTNIVYRKYLEYSYKLYNKVKTLVNPYMPRIFEGKDGIYVPSKITYALAEKDDDYGSARKDRTINKCEDLFLLETNEQQCVLILGSGGTGKTMLMRHLFLNAIESGYAIPILVNLRKYKGKGDAKPSILNLLFNSMQLFDIQMDQEQFVYSLKSGKYLVLYDGLDEIIDNYREEAAKEIEEIYFKYSNNKYVVTSRKVIEKNLHSDTGYFASSFSILKSFYFVEMAPLNLKRACSLVTKIGNPEDLQKTRKFQNLMKVKLWSEHKEFISSPLLLSIMYITYLDRLDDMLMNDLADYYTSVFDVLYSKHELSKADGANLRLLCEKLGYNKFKTLFSYICFQSYFAQQYEFTTQELIDLIRRGITKLHFREFLALDHAEDYIQDLVNRVCLLVQDGTIFTFWHRSIQSFFAASYATILTDEEQKVLIDAILPGHYIQSDFISFLGGIERERFNKIYLYPMISKILANHDYLKELVNFNISDSYIDNFSNFDSFIEKITPILLWIDFYYNCDDFNESENRVLQIIGMRDRIKNILLDCDYYTSIHNVRRAKEIIQQYLKLCRYALTKTKLLDVMEQWRRSKEVIENSSFQEFILNC